MTSGQTAGTGSVGQMTGTISELDGATFDERRQRASRNFAHLMAYVMGLYCAGGSSSVSEYEARELMLSVSYVLGIAGATQDEAAYVLDVEDPVALWHTGLDALEARTNAALELWREVVATMPPLRNVSLRDTLASLGGLRERYDTRFAAHEVPCDIDYQLSEPVDPGLMGIDYVEAWLSQLLKEARWIARFDTASCERVLERVCPDYRGLHVNLYDLLLPHEGELMSSGG